MFAGRDAPAARTYPTVVITLHLVCRLTKLIPYLDKEQDYKAKRAVLGFVKLGARCSGASSLHMACSRDTNRTFPFINLLLECGAPIDSKDNDGNTALHIAAQNKPVDAEVIQSLLQNGAHFDLVNNQKNTFYDLLQGTPLHKITNSAVHTSLKCLAARAVRKYDMKLDSLPLTLKDFVLNH